jgi:hypothetical protein
MLSLSIYLAFFQLSHHLLQFKCHVYHIFCLMVNHIRSLSLQNWSFGSVKDYLLRMPLFDPTSTFWVSLLLIADVRWDLWRSYISTTSVSSQRIFIFNAFPSTFPWREACKNNQLKSRYIFFYLDYADSPGTPDRQGGPYTEYPALRR